MGTSLHMSSLPPEVASSSRTDSCTVLGGAVSHRHCTPPSPVKISKCYCGVSPHLCVSPVSH
ncbi:strawberry notch homolog (Drosophila) (predicted), isoform CRA_a, partial [Rattus norvegicus]